jgi:protein gp37
VGNTTIEWTNKTWTPIRARVKHNAGQIAQQKQWSSLVQIATEMAGRVGPHCERVSPGCEHCYSENNNSRCLPHNGTGLPFDRRARDLVDVFVDEDILVQPLHWKKPQMIFVCSQTDLFGEWVPELAIRKVMAIIAASPRHTFQVLTKRPERMLAWSQQFKNQQLAADKIAFATDDNDCIPDEWDFDEDFECYIANSISGALGTNGVGWPMRNLWLGVSDEGNQHQRIDVLRNIPAAVRWVSFEPLVFNPGKINLDGIHWAVVGGESDTCLHRRNCRARPMKPNWARSIRDQAAVAKTAFLFKQWGMWAPSKAEPIRGKHTGGGIFVRDDGSWGNQGDWWDGRAEAMDLVGKKAAGRLLDGVLHDEYPEVRQ